MFNGGPVVREAVRPLIGEANHAYRERKLSRDSETFLRRWAADVRAEYRRAVLRRSFFRYLDYQEAACTPSR